MSWKTLTPAAKKKITADWNTTFADFGVYKPMHLLRRTGPLLMGVLLERGSSNDFYKPIFHVHNLARVFPVVSLALPREVPNEYVHVEWHDAKFQEITKRLGELAYMPLSGELALADIVDGFRSYQRKPSMPYEPDAFRDLALICGWCGNRIELANVLRETEKVMKQWPAVVLKQIGGLDHWLSGVRASAENQDELRAITAVQITKHGVGSIPATDLR